MNWIRRGQGGTCPSSTREGSAASYVPARVALMACAAANASAHGLSSRWHGGDLAAVAVRSTPFTANDTSALGA